MLIRLLLFDIVIRGTSDILTRAMSATEIIPGIYAVKGKFAGEFGYISSYLVVDDSQVLVIDPGTAGDPGNRIVKAIKSIGLNPSSDIIGILCTHSHPDHVGGASLLKKSTGAPLLVHSDDAEILSEPELFIKDRLAIDFAGRMAMKVDKGPLRVNYRGADADRLLQDGDSIEIGQEVLKVAHTGGHSAGHCAFFNETRKVLFSGDEINNFPNDPRKFYVDLSGSMARKSAFLDRVSTHNVDYVLPSHDVPHMFDNVKLELEQVKDAILHFQDTLLHHLRAREDADVEQLVFDMKQARSVPIPTSYDFLITTTIRVVLDGLKQAGLVQVNDKGVWSTN